MTPDFTAEALGMLAALMLAQSQYLFYKMASEKKMNAGLATHCIGMTAKQIVSGYGVAWPE